MPIFLVCSSNNASDPHLFPHAPIQSFSRQSFRPTFRVPCSRNADASDSLIRCASMRERCNFAFKTTSRGTFDDLNIKILLIRRNQLERSEMSFLMSMRIKLTSHPQNRDLHQYYYLLIFITYKPCQNQIAATPSLESGPSRSSDDTQSCNI